MLTFVFKLHFCKEIFVCFYTQSIYLDNAGRHVRMLVSAQSRD
ncbi:hypothetical protein LT85_3743 [Collimonas arenae]|uniref:Uncharacterized protein n=1 Tax=Collimonas arenae TaxID=279058 RepID=A0A0A1FEI0_9BURK|nr:hypothetical protein LT85_3743 [Collimonas arenae]